MRALIQRVRHASVTADGKVTGAIEQGFLVLLGVTETDTEAEVTQLTEKLLKLRLFSDAEGKTNCSIQDVGGSLLVISQFTLCADCRKGTRPSFSHAAKPDEANRLYELAAVLENAAGSGDEMTLMEQHSKAMAMYGKIVTAIEENLDMVPATEEEEEEIFEFLPEGESDENEE